MLLLLRVLQLNWSVGAIFYRPDALPDAKPSTSYLNDFWLVSAADNSIPGSAAGQHAVHAICSPAARHCRRQPALPRGQRATAAVQTLSHWLLGASAAGVHQTAGLRTAGQLISRNILGEELDFVHSYCLLTCLLTLSVKRIAST